MIGIVGSMTLEVERLRGLLERPEERVLAGLTFTSGLLCGREVTVAPCGVGKTNAAMYTQLLLTHYPVEAVLLLGVAGGIAPGLRRLTPVIADRLCFHDVADTTLTTCWPYLTELRPDARLRGLLLEAAGPDAVCGTILTGDRFIRSSAEREALYARFGALCVEMEGAAVGHVCTLNGVPFAVLRCLSDLADDGAHEDYEQFKQQVADQAAAILMRALPRI